MSEGLFELGTDHGCITGDCPHQDKSLCAEAIEKFVADLCQCGKELETQVVRNSQLVHTLNDETAELHKTVDEQKEVIRKLICDNERMDMLLKNMKIRAENMLLTLEVHKVG